MRTRLAIVLSLACLAGCATYRDTRLDDRLQPFDSPVSILRGIKPVQSRVGQDGDVAFAVAISGGGHRAANLAAGVMLGLESLPVRQHTLLQEIDYFSTASGGGFAAGSYLSALYDHRESGAPGDFRFGKALLAENGKRRDALRRDYQVSILTQWLHWRCTGFLDAGDLMQRAFDQYLLGSKDRPGHRSLLLGDMFKRAGSNEPVQMPYWIANASVYENGARFLFVPEFIHHYRIRRYAHNMRFASLNGDPFSVPLAVGMRASASFPVIIPATTFACEPEADKLNRYLHMVDGGLTDNLGVQTAIELLQQDPAPRKALLIIDAYAKSEQPYSAFRKSPDGPDAAIRVMKIGLDAKHVALQQEVQRLTQKEGIQCLTLEFEQLKTLAPNTELYERVRRIPTSLRMSAREQELLFEAGQILAAGNRDQLFRMAGAEETRD